MTAPDGAIAEIELGAFKYRIFRPLAGTVKVEKTGKKSHKVLMLDWREESGFLEKFDPDIVHEMAVLMLVGKWNDQAEDELVKRCKERYKMLPAWCLVDYARNTISRRTRV